MSLQVWLPFVRDTNNQGVSSIAPNITSTYGSITSNGKLGDCFHTTSTGDIDTGYSVDLTKTSVSLCGWFKFNKAEIQAVVSTKTYTTSAVNATANLIGNNSYGGIGICFTTNNLYADSKVLSALNIFGALRTTSPASNYTTTTRTITFDEWIHICVVYDKDALKLFSYFNGQLYATTNITAFTEAVVRDIYINYAHIYAGNGPACAIPYYCNDLRVYDHALSAKEIKELSKGLVAHYTLGGRGCDNILTNSTGYNGTTDWSGLISVATENDSPYFITKRTDTTSTSRTFITHSTITSLVSSWVAGDKFTISGYYRVPSSETYQVNANLFIRWVLSNGNNSDTNFYTPNTSAVIKDKWVRFETTLAVPANYEGGTANFYLSAFSQGLSTVHWKYIKLEKGSKATPWMPNSSDTEYNAMGYNDTTVYDSSGYIHNGSILGALTSSSDSARYSVSIKFSNNSHIYFTVPTTGYANSYTFAWWGNTSNYTGHMMWGFSDGNRLNLFMANSGNNFYLNTGDGANNPFGTVKPSVYRNAWHHFVITGDGSVSKLYIDGEYKADATTYRALTGTTIYMNGWNNSATYNFDGSLSDFRIYATCLSADDIKELYQVGASIDRSGNMYAYELTEV